MVCAVNVVHGVETDAVEEVVADGKNGVRGSKERETESEQHIVLADKHHHVDTNKS